MSLLGVLVVILIVAVVYLISAVLLPEPLPLVFALLVLVGFLTGLVDLPVR